MSDSTSPPFGFGKLVPGFDFLQNLVQAAGKAGGGSNAKLPGLSHWIAPTLNVEELERRIGELKTVQFWLEQNGKALGATIQALEVQKMSLATLKGMNLAMGDIARAFQLPEATAAPAAAAAGKRGGRAAAAPSSQLEGWPLQGTEKAPGNAYEKSFQKSTAADALSAAQQQPSAAEAPAPEAQPQSPGAAPGAAAAAATATATAPAAGMVDPMNWWSALTSQFQQIAGNALRDAATGNPALEASREFAGHAMKTVNRMAGSMLPGAKRARAAGAAGKSVAKKTAPRAAAKKAGSRAAPRKSATKTASAKRGGAA